MSSLIVLVAVPASGWGTCGALALASAAVALAAAGPEEPVVSRLPLAFILLVAATATIGVVAGFLGLEVWATTPGALALVCVGLLAATGVAAVRDQSITLVGDQRPVAVAGGLALLVAVLAPLVQPTETWLRHVSLGTDFSRHVYITGRVVDQGFQDYSAGQYPTGLHTLLGTLWRAGGGETFASAWTALQGATMLMLVLMFLAMVTAGLRLARRLQVPGSLSDVVLPIGTGVSFLFGVWLSTMMASGYVTSILAGLALSVALASTTREGAWGSTENVAVLTVCTVVMAYAWTLLVPLVAGTATASWVWSPRSSRVCGLLVLVAGALVTLPVGLGLAKLTVTEEGYRDDIQAPIQVALWYPDWWWYLLGGLAVVAVAVAWRQGSRDLFRALVTFGAATVVTVLAAGALTGASPEMPGYYVLKSAWTASNLLLPVGLAGGAWLLATGWSATQRLPTDVAATGARTGIAGVLLLLGAGALGRLSADGGDTLGGVQNGFGEPPFSYVAMTTLEQTQLQVSDAQPVLVWGVAPYGVGELLPFGSWYDRYVSEAIRWFDPMIRQLPLVPSVSRDAAAACTFLEANPDAIRVTGPSDAPGIDWLRAVGCPETVIRPDEWIRVPMDGPWWAGMPQEGQPYSYPTWQEHRDRMRSKLPGWGQYPPDPGVDPDSEASAQS